MSQEGIFVHNTTKAPSAGVFQLPIEFDQEKFVATWEPKGNAVDSKKQPQPIIGTQYASEGWKVWTYPSGHRLQSRPCEVPTKHAGVYVLMCRPKAVQDTVNAIYGNVSKQHLIRETAGEAIGGQLVTDAGILTDERIKQATGITEFGGDNPRVEMNRTPLGVRVEAPAQAVVRTD